MLALSRRPRERILFPSLNVAVEILQIKGNSVRVGIEAPPEVGVFREEIAPRTAARESTQPAASNRSTWSHTQRNQFNTAVLALHLVEKQLQAGLSDNAQSTLQYALKILEALDRSVEEERPSLHSDSPSRIGSSRNIETLLVEDDPVEESLLTSFLRLSGFRVETARDGYEALEYLARHPRPDFVLLDMRLPRLNGPATVSAIRNNPHLNGVRIFAVTGSSQAEAGVALGPDGVDQWFQKPVNPGLLAEAMRATARVN